MVYSEDGHVASGKGLSAVPTYLYRCRECVAEQDVIHLMAETPQVPCPRCGLAMRKVPALFAVGHGLTQTQRHACDQLRAQSDMRAELRQDFGVETVAPIGNRSFESMYRDVKASGGAVREQMAQKAEENSARVNAKQREWKKGAQRRAPKRTREIIERRKAEAAAGRAIRL